MSEQEDLSTQASVNTDTVSVTESVFKLLMDQTKQPVTCLPMHKNEVPFARDLNNPTRMTRVTYGCLSALLLDNTTRALIGLPLIDINHAQRAEIKRVMREAQFVHINGVGMVKKRTDDDRNRPSNQKQNYSTSTKVGENKSRQSKFKTDSSGIDPTTYQIIGHIHREMRNHPNEKPNLKMHEQGLREPATMTPETLEFLKVLHTDMVKNQTHSLKSELVKGAIGDILAKHDLHNGTHADSYTTSDDNAYVEEGISQNNTVAEEEPTPENTEIEG